MDAVFLKDDGIQTALLEEQFLVRGYLPLLQAFQKIAKGTYCRARCIFMQERISPTGCI
jgi:hypothetical protein